MNVEGAIKLQRNTECDQCLLPCSSASRPELSFGSPQRHTHSDDVLIHTEDEIEDALEESGPEDVFNYTDIGKPYFLAGIILQMLFM